MMEEGAAGGKFLSILGSKSYMRAKDPKILEELQGDQLNMTVFFWYLV